jgi:4-amino-4-deoxy-L-arabinose transferase-like glycosyltransferase
MLVGACLWVLLFPGTLTLGEEAAPTAGAVLIAVPLVYTALFGASYVTARALYILRMLSRTTLLCIAVAVSLGVAAVLALSGISEFGAPTSVTLVIVSFFAAASAVLVWWQVASTTKPIIPPPYEKRSSRRHRLRREGGSGGGERGTVEPAEVAYNELVVQWDPKAQRLLILHPDRSQFPVPLAEVDAGTLHGMSPPEVSRFIGDCFTRLIPGLQSVHEKSSENREREGT